MTEWKRGYQKEEKKAMHYFRPNIRRLTIFHKMKNSRNKTNILFLRQGIEEDFIDDLTKAFTSTGNVFK